MRFLTRTNPVVRVIASMLATVGLLFVLHPLPGLITWLLTMILLRIDGVTFAAQLRRTWFLLLLAPLAAVSMALYGTPGGRIYVDWEFAIISDASLWNALAVSTRVLGLGAPVVLLLSGIDPTDLADGLTQILHAPEKLVWGSIAGLRMMHLFPADWKSLALARRARGLGDGWALRRWASMSFAMLVMALRRASKLATAMEARGFGGGRRSHARRSRLGWRDGVLVAIAVSLAAVALVSAAVPGWFR